MMSTVVVSEEMDEDIAIAKAMQDACFWVKRVTNIDAAPNIWLEEEKPVVQINKHKKELQKIVPPNYICRRCRRPGHHITQCITNGDRTFDPVIVRGVAGIPRSFTSDLATIGMPLFCIYVYLLVDPAIDKNVFKRPDGSYCSVAPRLAQFMSYAESLNEAKATAIPAHLTCTLCKNLIKKPLYFPCCCTTSFCTECVMPSEELCENFAHCPICNRYIYSLSLSLCALLYTIICFSPFLENVIQRN